MDFLVLWLQDELVLLSGRSALTLYDFGEFLALHNFVSSGITLKLILENHCQHPARHFCKFYLLGQVKEPCSGPCIITLSCWGSRSMNKFFALTKPIRKSSARLV